MVNQKVRKLVLERDKKCVECQSEDSLTIDHIIPLSKGGTNAPSNLRVLCKPCNVRKGSRIGWTWLERIVMAFHVEEIITNVENRLRAIISHNLALLRKEMSDHINNMREARINEISKAKGEVFAVVDMQNKEIAFLKNRLRVLESYLKVEWYREESITEGYRKIPTKV